MYDPRQAQARTRALLEAADVRREMDRVRSIVVELRTMDTALCNEAADALESLMEMVVI